MMVIGYVKRTASRKTEQCKLRWKDKNSSTIFKQFQRATRKQRLETSYSPSYKLPNKKRMSYVYHVEFPHIFKELEVKTVQFLGGECMFILSRTSPSPSVSHNVRTVFIFSAVSLASSLYTLSIFNKCRHFIVVQTTKWRQTMIVNCK